MAMLIGRSLVCPNCKSDELERTEDGAMTCTECGMQLFGVREEINEAIGTTALGASSTRRKVSRPQTHDEDSAVSSVTILNAFEAFQFSLQQMLRALVSQCGLDERLPSRVGQIWLAAARSFPEAMDPNSATSKLIVLPTMQGSTGAPCADLTLSMVLALQLCYLGALELALPVLPHDFVAWCKSGQLQFCSAHHSLPRRLQPVAHSSVGHHLWPKRVPRPHDLCTGAALLCERLKRLPPPPPDLEPLVRRICSQLLLPCTVRDAALGASSALLGTPRTGGTAATSSSGAHGSNSSIPFKVPMSSAGLDGFRARDTWLQALACTLIAVKLSCELTGEICMDPSILQASTPTHLSRSERRWSWSDLEQVLALHLRREELGGMWPTPHGHLQGVPNATHPVDARQALAVGRAGLFTYLDFITTHVFVEKPQRKEMQQEAEGLRALSQRHHQVCACNSQQVPHLLIQTARQAAPSPSSTSEPKKMHARDLTLDRHDAVSSSQQANGYLLSEESCTRARQMPSLISPDGSPLAMPARYSLLLRGAACLLHEDWRRVHMSLVDLERSLLQPHKAKERRSDHGTLVAMSCAHCGDHLGGLCCTRCGKHSSACQCGLPICLCKRCRQAGVASNGGGQAEKRCKPDYTRLILPTPCKCLSCGELFFYVPTLRVNGILQRPEAHGALCLEHNECSLAISGSSAARRLLPREVDKLIGTSQFELARHLVIRQLQRTLQSQTRRSPQTWPFFGRAVPRTNAQIALLCGARIPLKEAPRLKVNGRRLLKKRDQHFFTSLGYGWALAIIPPLPSASSVGGAILTSNSSEQTQTQDSNAAGEEMLEPQESTRLSDEEDAEAPNIDDHGAPAPSSQEVSFAGKAFWISPDGLSFDSLRKACLHAQRHCRQNVSDSSQVEPGQTLISPAGAAATSDGPADNQGGGDRNIVCRLNESDIPFDRRTFLDENAPAGRGSTTAALLHGQRPDHADMALAAASAMSASRAAIPRDAGSQSAQVSHEDASTEDAIAAGIATILPTRVTDNFRDSVPILQRRHPAVMQAQAKLKQTASVQNKSAASEGPRPVRMEVNNRTDIENEDIAKAKEAQRLRKRKQENEGRERKRKRDLERVTALGWAKDCPEISRDGSRSAKAPIFTHPLHGSVRSVKEIIRFHDSLDAHAQDQAQQDADVLLQ